MNSGQKRGLFAASIGISICVATVSLAVTWSNHLAIVALKTEQDRLNQERLRSEIALLMSKAFFSSMKLADSKGGPDLTDEQWRARIREFAKASCSGFEQGYAEADKSRAKPEDIAIFNPMIIACAGIQKAQDN